MPGTPVLKSLLFGICLLPLAGCLGGILQAAGFSSLPGFDLGADPSRFVLDTLAKTALNLLLLTLLVTPLQRLTRQPQLLSLRRRLGLFAFSYALLHVLVYLGPYRGFDWREITKDLGKRPYISLGFCALLLLLPLAVTSSDRMMRRLGRRWQRLHRLIYPASVLVVLHFWKMLKHEYRQPLLYAVILALLLGFRLWQYLRRRRGGSLISRSGPPRAPETA